MQRLNKRTPNWKSEKGKADPADLEILAIIANYEKSNSFYHYVKKYNGLYGVCGTTTYEEDVSNLLWKAETLYKKYGKIYCLRFLQGSTIIINEDNERAALIWNKIYDLLINSLSLERSFEEIKLEYESAEIQYKELEDWEMLMWEFEFQKSKYFIEIGGVTLYFKTIACPDEQDKFKSCQPENLEQLKLESELYKKIKEYAL